MTKKYNIYVVSDSLGDTAEHVARAVAEQFKNRYTIKKYPNINNKIQIDEIVDESVPQNMIVIFTLVIDDLRNYFINKCSEKNIRYIDLMTPLIHKFKKILNTEPINQPGVNRRINRDYFRKIESIEFAVKYDDGKDPRGIKEADIVLIGVSRTSKTPLGMYLAYKKYKTINIPIIKNTPLPDELFKIAQNKIIGLTMNPIALSEIRRERLKMLRFNKDESYTDMKSILEELDYAEKIMKKINCPILDISNKAIEETANIIIDILQN